MQSQLENSVTMDRDEQLLTLLSRCALRDQVALRELYELVASKLTGIAYRITGSKELAEDVIQISFTQIWKDAERYRPDIARPLTWMTSIVRHRALDHVKANRRRGRVIDETIELETMQLVSTERGPMDHFELAETEGKLKACMKLLSNAQQRAVMLAYYYGYSRQEVSRKLQTPIGTIKSWLHRGLQRLEACLSP